MVGCFWTKVTLFKSRWVLGINGLRYDSRVGASPCPSGENAGFADTVSGLVKGFGQSFLDSQAQVLAGGIGVEDTDSIESSIQIHISESELSGARLASSTADHAGSVMAVIGLVGAAKDLDSKSFTKNLRKLKDKYLKDLGIDAHAAKEILNGSNKRNARFDLMVDKKTGQVFQKTKDGTIIPSDYSLDELKNYAPLNKR